MASLAHITFSASLVWFINLLHSRGLPAEEVKQRVPSRVGFHCLLIESHCRRLSTRHNYSYSDSQSKIPFTTQFSGTTEHPATVQLALITFD